MSRNQSKSGVTRALLHSAFLALGSYVLTSSVSAADCLPASTMSVTDRAFDQVTAQEAFRTVLAGMPYRIEFIGYEDTSRISARDLTGPLNDVLNRVAKTAGVTWRQYGCVIRLTTSPGAKQRSLADKQAELQERAKRPLKVVTYVGSPSPQIPVLVGSASQVNVTQAIRQIVPGDWRVTFDQDWKQDRTNDVPVDWVGGISWISVLDDVASSAKLLAEADWTTRTVYIAPMPPALVQKLEDERPKSAEEIAQMKAVAAAQAEAEKNRIAAEKAAEAERIRCQWTVTKDDNLLSEVVKRWGKQAGYNTVFMEAQDDPILRGAATFCGTINEATVKLLNSIPDRPVKAKFYEGNKAIQLLSAGK